MKSRYQLEAEVEAAARAIHRERCKAWRDKNPEKSREASRRWAARNPDSKRVSNRLWKFFNRDRDRALTAEWRKKNPDYARERRERLKAEGAYKPGGKYWYSRTKEAKAERAAQRQEKRPCG